MQRSVGDQACGGLFSLGAATLKRYHLWQRQLIRPPHDLGILLTVLCDCDRRAATCASDCGDKLQRRSLSSGNAPTCQAVGDERLRRILPKAQRNNGDWCRAALNTLNDLAGGNLGCQRGLVQ
jgi:hypothetical protein